jgi:hypothetical protein
MKLLERFINWWNATERVEPAKITDRGLPHDHFDKAGRYIFKDQKNKLVADYAAQLGASMSTVSFNTPVVVNPGFAGATTMTITMSGVVSAQPIIIVVYTTNPSSATLAGTVTDTFATSYGYTLLGANVQQAVFIGTGGTGTSGVVTFTVSVGESPFGGYAVSCINAATGALGTPTTPLNQSAFGPQVYSTIAYTPTLTPTNSTQGCIAGFVSGVSMAGGYQGSPWVSYGSGTGISGMSLYAGPPSGTGLEATWGYASYAGDSYSYILLINSLPTAPSAPTLTSPANGGYQDVISGATFTATYNSTDGATQNAYALRVKVSGGSYSYWNASSNSLVGSAVWNALTVLPGSTMSATLPSGIISDGHTYNWSLASQESLANLQGAFASDGTFTAQQAPVTTITAPTAGNILTSLPPISWTNTYASGATQIDYQVIVESGSYGSIPGSGTSAWNSGVVSSASLSVICGATLTTGTPYRIFVQVTQTGSQIGAWAYVTITPVPNPPAVPLITALAYNDPTTGLPETQITIVGQDNLLTANQSSLESNATTGWAAGSNTTITASTTWFQSGAYSLQLAATAAGAVSATTPTGVSGVAVSAGQVVRAMGYFHSPTTARSCTVAIGFYNAAGTLISTSTSPAVNSTTTGNGTGHQAFITLAAPTNTARATLIINGAALGSGEYLYADCMFLGPGTSTVWTIGGLVGLGAVVVTSSDGHLVRGAGWEGNTPLGSNQTVVIYDVEAPPGISYTYSAAITATSSGVVVTGAPGVSNAITNSSENRAWLLDPTIPAGAVGFYMGTNWQPKIHEVGQAYYPLGYGTATKSTDGTKGIQGIIPIFTSSIAEEQAVEALLSTTNVLFFMTPARGGYYVMSDPSQDRMGTAPFEWENTKTPNIQWTFYVLGSQRP